MATNNLLDTSTVSLSDIIGNGKIYQVPAYQRDYSWQRDHWEDLWADILMILAGGSVHYMGSIVLQNQGDKRYVVIDGQQRLATLSLIVLATIRNIQHLIDEQIDPENNTERIRRLSQKFLGDKDPASLTYSAKLTLNENNNGFYQSHLMVFRPPINERTLRDSDKLLWQAYNFFYERIRVYFKGNTNGEELANFLNRMVAEKILFIQIIVENELSAYTVFETLNSQGERLTVTDLLKNYLFSLATSPDLNHIKEKWTKTVDTVGLDIFPAFLRHFWIASRKLIRQSYLFKAMKESVKTSPQVIDLLDELEKNAQLYNALSNYSDPFWTGQREQKKRIKELELFKERQAYPLLLAAYNQFSAEEFTKILRVVSVITFRYSVIGGLQSTLKEEVYNKAAMRVSSGETDSVAAVALVLKPLYPSDRNFKNDFSTIVINTKRNRKLIRYILFELENHLAQTDVDYEDNPGTIEHILPENADEAWNTSFPVAIQALFVYRLGNYALLEVDKNRDSGTKSFPEKKSIYQTSQYQLTKEIKAHDWTPNTLDIRQNKLADYAGSIWRLPYFD